MIAIVTALREELAPLLRRARIDRVVRLGDRRAHVGSLNGTAVVLMTTGPGVAAAEKNLAKLLREFHVDEVIGAGVAGGIAPDLRVGDIICGTAAQTKVSVPHRRGLADECGTDTSVCAVVAHRRIATVATIVRDKHSIDADAIDMESDGWKRAAAGVPLRILRVIFDAAGEEIPAFIGDAVNRAAVVRYAMLHPAAVPVLVKMRNRMRDCCEKLADVISRSIATPQHRLAELLEATSRTFALCIPLLDEGIREQVELAYLLFRIADTFEDASHWPIAERLAALDAFCALLAEPKQDEAERLASRWLAKRPSSHPGYLRLIAEVPMVVDAFAKLPPEPAAVIRDHVIRSARGMAHFVGMTINGRLQLIDMEQLRAYCYAVAGIVGEMLTELFLINAPQLRSAASTLRSRAATFGEGLQLVNILKDSRTDLVEGRTYIPPGAERSDVIALASMDLEAATEYTLALQNSGAPRGMVAFAALPVALARATLERRATKISRPEVFRITQRIRRSVARGEPPLALPYRGRSRLSLLFGMR